PQLGESVTEGTITTWLVQAGDQVNKYDSIAEVMTDKVNAEVPSSFTGVIQALSVDEGDTVAVGEVICEIETEDSGGPSKVAPSEDSEQKNPVEQSAPVEQTEDQSMKKRYSPAVLRISQE